MGRHLHPVLLCAVAMALGCNTCLGADGVPFNQSLDLSSDEGSTQADVTLPDIALPDSGTSDSGTPDSGPDAPIDMACQPATDEQFCAAISAECGTVNGTDPNCLGERIANCGECPDIMLCGDGMCGCPDGYVRADDTCNDRDECQSDPCDDEAECENEPGGFTCTCEEDYYGDGFDCDPLPVLVGSTAVATDGSANINVSTVTIDPSITYILGVSIRTAFRQVEDVSGLGATWRRLATSCDLGSSQRLEVWIAENVGGAALGTVSVTLDGPPFASAVLLSRFRNVGAGVTARIFNESGEQGPCGGALVAAPTYSNQVSTTVDAGLMFGVTATTGSSHVPAAPFVPRLGTTTGTSTDDAGIASMSAPFTQSQAFNVGGTLSPAAPWISTVIELPAD